MKRSVHVVVLALLAFLLLGPIPKSLAGPLPNPDPRLKTAAASDASLGVSPNDAAGYGTGTILHADALRTGDHALLDVDVAFSGAAFSSAAPSRDYTNEVHRLVTPKLAANAGRGRGTGLELGLGSDPVPLIGQLALAAAPPSTGLIEHVVGPLGVPGVLTADLLRSQAQSRSDADGCVLGPDQAYGLGSVLNLNVLNGLLSTVASPPLREISQSTSTTRIVPGSTPGRLGLRSETRQTIAPVTFFKGLPGQFTVEVLGEWALRATADGAKGQVSYGPLSASPETPVLRILGDHGQVVGQLTTQQLLSDKGLEITIPGVAEIVLGEDPRMIGGDASSNPVAQPAQAAAAVDVVRVKLLTGSLADVRVGHMEAAVAVPAEGVQCPGIKVTHTVDTPAVTPGQDFVYTVTVTNPDDCDLTHLKLVETPTGTDGVKFTLVSATPSGSDLSDTSATWPDLGPLAAGQTKTVTIKVTIPADSAPGKLTALAVATGVCPAKPLPTTDVHPPTIPGIGPGSPDDIPLTGEASVDGPKIGICIVPGLTHDTLAEAKAALEAAGCTLGTVTDGGPPENPGDLGKVVDQAPPATTQKPFGTPVDVTLGGPLCTVPPVSGLTPDDAKTKLLEAGCTLGTVTTDLTGKPAEPGKITSQTPPAGDKVPIGTPVNVMIAPPLAAVAAGTTSAPGVGIAGQRLTSEAPAPAAAPAPDTAPTLARTGGVALAGLALWLLFGGLLTQLAGSERLWRLTRRSGH